MLKGLSQAIREAGFSPRANKIVLTIGDMGDKSYPADIDPALRALQEKRHADLFRELLGRLQPSLLSPISFYAVQVEKRDPQSPIARHPDAVHYEMEMQEIAEPGQC